MRADEVFQLRFQFLLICINNKNIPVTPSVEQNCKQLPRYLFALLFILCYLYRESIQKMIFLQVYFFPVFYTFLEIIGNNLSRFITNWQLFLVKRLGKKPAVRLNLRNKIKQRLISH